MGHIFLSFLFFNVILIVFYSNYRKGHYYIKKSTLVFYTLLLIAFGTYGTGEGDYLTSKMAVEMVHSAIDLIGFNGMEIQYNYLAYYVDGNYTLWRLVVFSIQFVGMSVFLYKARLNTYPIFLAFIVICLLQYTYQRSYWGVIFFFLGLYLLLEKKNPLFLLVIGLCYFSHTQNVALLALLPLGFINLKRWQLLAVIPLIGILAVYFKDFLQSIIDSGSIIEDADYLNNKIAIYGEGNTEYFGSSIGEFLLFVLRYVPMFVIVISWGKMILTRGKGYLLLNKPYRGIINITIGLVIAALVILSASSLGIGILFYRVLSMALFPLVLILPNMMESNLLKRKGFNMIILAYIVCSEYSYIKDMYYAYASGAF